MLANIIRLLWRPQRSARWVCSGQSPISAGPGAMPGTRDSAGATAGILVGSPLVETDGGCRRGTIERLDAMLVFQAGAGLAPGRDARCVQPFREERLDLVRKSDRCGRRSVGLRRTVRASCAPMVPHA